MCKNASYLRCLNVFDITVVSKISSTFTQLPYRSEVKKHQTGLQNQSYLRATLTPEESNETYDQMPTLSDLLTN